MTIKERNQALREERILYEDRKSQAKTMPEKVQIFQDYLRNKREIIQKFERDRKKAKL